MQLGSPSRLFKKGKMIDEENSSRRSTPVPSFIIDPFIIGPDHVNHYSSARIIKVESIGKVFCPTCLSNTSALNDIMAADEDLFDSYVNNLFVILDNNFEEEQIRKIIIRMIHILLTKRTLKLKTDSEFHNLLRIIYRVMMCDTFTWYELSPLSRIFSRIAKDVIDANPIPLRSIGKVIKFIDNYTKKQLTAIDTMSSLDEDSAEFIGSVSVAIDAYLSILGRFTIGQIADLIFPLLLNDTAETHNQQYYKDSQQECLRFVRVTLIPKCWNIMAVGRDVNKFELNLLNELFICINQCFTSAIRMKDEKYLTFLKNSDFMAISHSLIYRYKGTSLEKYVRNFIRHYVLHFVQDYIGTDRSFQHYRKLDDLVETNHKMALEASKDRTKFKRTVFYFLANYVAEKQESKYFKKTRVRRIVKLTRPIKLDMLNSVVLMRAHASLLPIVLNDSLGIESEDENRRVLQTIKEVWQILRKENSLELFREVYCFNSDIFLWAYKNKEYQELFNEVCLEYILMQSLKDRQSERVLECILRELYYQELFQKYLSSSEGSTEMLKKLIEESPCKKDNPKPHLLNQHVSTIRNLSTLISSLFYRFLLEYINGQNEDAYLENVARVISSINYLMTECDHFDFEVPDDKFIDDLFTVLERLYRERAEVDCTLIISINDLITLMMSQRHQYLMSILSRLEFCVMGLMYERIADYTKGDQLAESIARLLVAYDEIDYPLRYSIEDSLIMMTHSTFNWMLFQNADLQLLAIKLVQKALETEASNSRRACTGTGFLHMLITNPCVLNSHLKLIKSVLFLDEVIYNPLLQKVLPVLPTELKQEVEERLGLIDERCLTPALSFSSSDDSDILENHDVVSDIISKLYDAEPHRESNSSKVPNFLYVSRSIDETELVAPDLEDWAQRAYQTTQNGQE